MPATQTPEGIRVDYTEPTTTKTGTPLTDLAKTTIYFDLGAGPQVAVEVPASAPTGGGAVSQVIQVPVAVDSEVDVQVWVTATDSSGNESVKSNTVIVRVDTLPPNAPTL